MTQIGDYAAAVGATGFKPAPTGSQAPGAALAAAPGVTGLAAPAPVAPVLAASTGAASAIAQQGFLHAPQAAQRAGVAQFIADFFTAGQPGAIRRDQFITVAKQVLGGTGAQAAWDQLDPLDTGFVRTDAVAKDLASGHVFRDFFGKLFDLQDGGSASRATAAVVLLAHGIPGKEATGFLDWLGRGRDGKISADDLDGAFGALEFHPEQMRPFRLTV